MFTSLSKENQIQVINLLHGRLNSASKIAQDLSAFQMPSDETSGYTNMSIDIGSVSKLLQLNFEAELKNIRRIYLSIPGIPEFIRYQNVFPDAFQDPFVVVETDGVMKVGLKSPSQLEEDEKNTFLSLANYPNTEQRPSISVVKNAYQVYREISALLPENQIQEQKKTGMSRFNAAG